MSARSRIDFDEEQIAHVKEHSYYKQLQAKLREQQKRKTQTDDKERENIEQQEDNKVHQSSKVQTELRAKSILNITDQIHLSKSKKKYEDILKKNIKKTAIPSDKISSKKEAGSDAVRILKFLGFKIDLTNKLSDIVEAFMRNVVQARTHNFFLRKYAQFKVGVLGQILSSLDLTQEELRKLQKKALGEAIEENIKLMGENLYNLELTELVHGNSRKVRKSLSMFREVERQLIKQMALLGGKHQWTASTLLEERIKQCNRIKEEFIRERDALLYLYEYVKQDKWVG